MGSYWGEIAALGTAACWTVTSMAFESAGKRIGSMAVNLIRLVMALGFLTVWGAIVRGQALPLDASGHNWLWLSISGLVGFAIGDLCLFRAFVLVGARISMLIMSLVPPITALTGWLLMGEVLSALDWVGMTITIAGVAWVIMERKKVNGAPVRIHSRLGILLAFLGASGQAIGLALSKYGMGNYDAFAANQIRVIAGIGGFCVLLTAIRWWPKVFSSLGNRPAMLRTSLGAFFGPFLGVGLSLLAVQYTETGVAATIMAIVPVMIIPPAILVFKEHISLRAVLGALLAVGGVSLLFL